MPTMTLTPKNFGKKIGEIYDRVIAQDRLTIHFEATMKPTPEKSVKKGLRELVEDPDNTVYGPISADEFVALMKKW